MLSLRHLHDAEVLLKTLKYIFSGTLSLWKRYGPSETTVRGIVIGGITGGAVAKRPLSAYYNGILFFCPGIEICITFPTEYVKTQLQLDERSAKPKFKVRKSACLSALVCGFSAPRQLLRESCRERLPHFIVAAFSGTDRLRQANGANTRLFWALSRTVSAAVRLHSQVVVQVIRCYFQMSHLMDLHLAEVEQCESDVIRRQGSFSAKS